MAWLTKVTSSCTFLYQRLAFSSNGVIEVGVGAQRRQKRRLVIRAAAHPAVGDARPFGDGVARADHFLDVARGLEKLVRVAAAAGVGRGAQDVFALVVQGVVEPRQHPHRVAERRMRRHILDPFAVNPDLAAVPQALHEFLRR